MPSSQIAEKDANTHSLYSNTPALNHMHVLLTESCVENGTAVI